MIKNIITRERWFIQSALHTISCVYPFKKQECFEQLEEHNINELGKQQTSPSKIDALDASSCTVECVFHMRRRD